MMLGLSLSGRSYSRALTAFFNWVVRESFLADSPMMREKVAKPNRKMIKPNTLEQVEGMLAVCEWGIKVSIYNF